MKTIRNRVFETNSSSCHCISFINDSYSKELDLQDIEVNIDGEYGWGYGEDNLVKYPKEKLDYYLTMCTYFMKNDEFEEYCKKIIKYFESENCKIIINLTKVTEYNGEETYRHGYIDHQSVDNIKFASLDELFTWVYTKGTGVYVTNDNRYEEGVTIYDKFEELVY